MNFEAEAARVRAFVGDGNYHAAYNIALSAMNACRRDGDQAGVDDCIALIRELVDSLAAEFGGQPAD